jgi:hypothetical protein
MRFTGRRSKGGGLEVRTGEKRIELDVPREAI